MTHSDGDRGLPRAPRATGTSSRPVVNQRLPVRSVAIWSCVSNGDTWRVSLTQSRSTTVLPVRRRHRARPAPEPLRFCSGRPVDARDTLTGGLVLHSGCSVYTADDTTGTVGLWAVTAAAAARRLPGAGVMAAGTAGAAHRRSASYTLPTGATTQDGCYGAP